MSARAGNPGRRTGAAAILVCLGLAGAVLALYAPVIDYPFLDLDDFYYVLVNPGIRDLSWSGVEFLYLDDLRDFRYFPTTYLSFAIDYRLFGLDPAFFHATNVALHVLNTLLVFVLLRTLTRDTMAAGIAALLFGLHPLQIESVAWVMGRKNVLFLAFFLAALLAYLGYARQRDHSAGRALVWLSVSVLLFAASVTAKSAAVTLPALLVLVDAYLEPERRRELGSFLKRSLPSKLGYLPVVGFVYVMTRIRAERSPFLTDYDYAWHEWVGIVGHNLFFYIGKTLVPLRLAVFYPLPEAQVDSGLWLPAHFYAFTLLSALLVAVAIWAWQRSPTILLGVGWYLVTLLPMALLTVFFRDLPILAADRYFYQSSIGLFLLVGVGSAWAWRRLSTRGGLWRGAVVLASVGVIAGLYVAAVRQRETWRSTLDLYEQVVRHHPSDEFYYRLALEYQNTEQMSRALMALDFAEAAPHQIFFTRVFSYQMRLADLYRQKGELAKAAAFVESAIGSTPNAFEPVDVRTPLAYLHLADLLERAGESERAASLRGRARAAKVDSTATFESLWFRLDPEGARQVLEQRVAAAPDDAVAWYYLGLLYQVHDRPERASACAERARALGFAP